MLSLETLSKKINKNKKELVEMVESYKELIWQNTKQAITDFKRYYEQIVIKHTYRV